MRFLGRLLPISLLLLFMFSVSVYAGTRATVTGTKVNIRTEPSTASESNIFEQVPYGTIVEVTGQDGSFYTISYKGKNLFIHRDFVAVSSGRGTINATNVNVRKYPSRNHDPLGQVDTGASFDVVGKSGDWVAILYNNDSGAFIHKDYIDVPNYSDLRELTVDIPDDEQSLGLVAGGKNQFYAVVSSSTGLKMRDKPSTEAAVVSTFAYGTTLDIVENHGEWILVRLDGEEGYMFAEFITIMEGKRPENHRGQRIVDFARKYLGTPYVWGGTSLTKGVDCSGFVYSVYANFGITLNRTSRYQYGNGYPVKKGELQIGDLVFFDTDGAGVISHVGIYIGGGQFIHSSSAKSSMKVMISSLGEAYYVRTYYGACRVL